MRERILYFSIKYAGNYDKILSAINSNRPHEAVEYNGNYLTIIDEHYPKRLLALNKPPLILYYHGNITLLERKAVSIVGSRNAQTYASEQTNKLIKSFKEDLVIVSGMAKGIDSVAHISAIKNGLKTIAVLGSGINYVYPKANQQLYTNLCANHLVISEFPNITVPKPYFFPFRNRIIAALGLELYVMQANIKSGTMLTVNEALELNRDIYVLPYRIDDQHGAGCNLLIEQGANIILTNSEN